MGNLRAPTVSGIAAALRRAAPSDRPADLAVFAVTALATLLSWWV